MLCVLILYISGGTCSLKSAPNDRYFGKFFMAIFFYSEIQREEIADEIFFSYVRTYVRTYVIGYKNPSVRIIDLVSHTTYAECVNFYTSAMGPRVESRLRTKDFLRNFSFRLHDSATSQRGQSHFYSYMS